MHGGLTSKSGRGLICRAAARVASCSHSSSPSRWMVWRAGAWLSKKRSRWSLTTPVTLRCKRRGCAGPGIPKSSCSSHSSKVCRDWEKRCRVVISRHKPHLHLCECEDLYMCSNNMDFYLIKHERQVKKKEKIGSLRKRKLLRKGDL